MEATNKLGITNVEIRIGLGVIICLVICFFVPDIQRLAACTAVVMCTQEIQKATYKAGLTRLLGVLCGGIAGVLVVLLDGVFGNDFIFFILCGVGIVLNFILCHLAKMPPITARVSVITFCLVTFLLTGNARLMYAVNRFVGTLVGAVVALLLAFIWQKIHGADKKPQGN